MGLDAVEVSWELAADDAMRNVVARGVELAVPQLAHSVHVEVEGLQPDRWYWYRFRAGDAESPIGRTRTLPPPDSLPKELRIAVASCQHYEAGLYTAYQHMARQDLDLVVHLGDYIYEYGVKQNKKKGKDRVRNHIGGEIKSLDDYRIRYALYKCDEHLQASHAIAPWMVVWDDHEIENNYANDLSEDSKVTPAEFLARRANAYQAYYEHLPLRRRSLPRGPDLQLYRKASFGRLAELLFLDTRQYRSDQPNSARHMGLTDEAFSQQATLLGRQQRGWMEAALIQSPAQWNVLAQQVMMAQIDLAEGSEQKYYMDGWAGYSYERREMLQFMADRRVPNPIVLTGDFHANWVNDLRLDDRNQSTPIIATEFIGTSISSGGDGEQSPAHLKSALDENPCVRFHNHERGYVYCKVTPESWTSDFLCVEYVTRPGAPLVKRATFVVENGTPGAKPA